MPYAIVGVIIIMVILIFAATFIASVSLQSQIGTKVSKTGVNQIVLNLAQASTIPTGTNSNSTFGTYKVVSSSNSFSFDPSVNELNINTDGYYLVSFKINPNQSAGPAYNIVIMMVINIVNEIGEIITQTTNINSVDSSNRVWANSAFVYLPKGPVNINLSVFVNTLTGSSIIIQPNQLTVTVQSH